MNTATSPNTGVTTTASLVYERLRTDLLFGVFPAGSKLAIDALREKYSVGSIPVREALNRLSAEGLVAQADQKGFFVPGVSVDELVELTRTRCLLHRIAIPDSLANGDAEWENRLVLAAHHLSKTPRQPSGSARLNPEWETRHRAFHLAIVDGSPSRWIKDFHAHLFDLSDRYRHEYLTAESITGSRDVVAEHKQILDAAVERSSEKLIALLDEHAQETTKIITRHAPRVATVQARPRTSRRRLPVPR